MRAIEFITEARNRMYQYIKSIVPTWPEYIVKDWLYQGFGRYNDENPKRKLLTMLNREGLNRNTQWQFVPNMKFTMDNMWTSHTLRKLQGRAGGLSDMGMDVPRDAERHATQAQLAQKQGGIRSEPVILIKRPDGYELLEGWHRTIQHFHKFPDGYTGPAYIAVSRGQQGVAEGSQEINWVKPNFDFEWHEVEEQSRMKQVPVDVRQYYQKHFPNKDAWLKAVQNGKAVVVPPDHAYEIRNAPFDKASLQKVLAPTGHEGPIGPAKEKRVNDLFDKGQVEMPIILKTSQGLWLIGGKTRLGTANYVKGLPAKVWLISGKQGVAEGKLVESAVFLNPTTVVVGQAHGQPLELSPNTLKQIQAIAAKHGAWYEGNGTDRGYTKGQIDRYVGSWDDEVAKTASSNDPKWLYVLFANVDENNRVQRVGIDPNDTIFNRLLDTAKDNSFQGIGYTSQALQKFLQMASEGKYDFVKMSQQPATQENLTRFLKAGEALMWPSNWEQYPNKAGKIAKAATVDVRDQYLATRKAGVYVTGSGHLKAVQNITGKQSVAEDN